MLNTHFCQPERSDGSRFRNERPIAALKVTCPGVLIAYLTALLMIVTACAQSSPSVTTQPATRAPATQAVSPAFTPSPAPSASPSTAPSRYTAHILYQGSAHPDDLAFDQQGRLLFSDARSGFIDRLNADGSLTRIYTDPAVPEGMVVLPDGTLIFAEQTTNRILALASGASTPTVLRNLPGTPSTANCKDGVDGIALDPTTNTLIIPDSPTGNVYRMSLDGKSLSLLATDIVRPVGASVDSQGNVYIADECGGAVWRITRTGQKTRFGGFGMPDDVISDGYGNILVVDLAIPIHSLIRLNPATGQHTVLASRGYIEPQGLAVDAQGNIYVADDYANIIVKYTPV